MALYKIEERKSRDTLFIRISNGYKAEKGRKCTELDIFFQRCRIINNNYLPSAPANESQLR